MYKSNLCQHEKDNYSNLAYNLLSPKSNQKTKKKQFLNSNAPKFKPINLYSTYMSPPQNDKNFSVKNITSPDDKLKQDLMNKFSNYQKNCDDKMLKSPNSNNSDLLTIASLTTQQSTTSILSNNANTSTYMPTAFQPMINNYTIYQFPNQKYNYSNANYPKINYFYPVTNTPFLNGNYSSMQMKYNNMQQGTMTYKQNKNNKNMGSNANNNTKFKKKSFGNNMKTKASNTEKKDVSNFNSNNSIKSGNESEKSNSNSSSNNTMSSKASVSNNNINSKDNVDNKNEKINNNNGGANPRKKYYNKFNSPKENNIANENTVILTIKIKVGPNDFRTFNLKKYDDLFISLEKFFDLNKIKQDLVKPIVTKIFAALNKIFWLLNNKIGKYDLDYLNSLQKLWEKNNGKIPKRKEENGEIKTKDINENDKKTKESSDKSTISSSDSTDENKNHKKILSNSFQNMDTLSEDEKRNSVHSI